MKAVSVVTMLLTLCVGGALVQTDPAVGADSSNAQTLLPTPLLSGYDPVAYFMHSAAVRGDASMQATVAGKTYYFSMQEHIDLFKANPARYLPQFDGLCAQCLADGQRRPGDPTQFAVRDNRLYFNADVATQTAFEREPDNVIARASSRWASVTNREANAAGGSVHTGNIAGKPTATRIDAPKYTAQGELIYPADVENWVAMGASLGMGYNEQEGWPGFRKFPPKSELTY